MNFLEIFLIPKILSIKLLGKSWGNRYADFLVLMIEFRFGCGEEKLW